MGSSPTFGFISVVIGDIGMVLISELKEPVNIEALKRDYSLFRRLDNGQRLIRKKTALIKRDGNDIGYRYGLFVTDGNLEIHVIDRFHFSDTTLKSPEFNRALAEFMEVYHSRGTSADYLKIIESDSVKRAKKMISGLGYKVSFPDVKMLYCEEWFNIRHAFDTSCEARYGNAIALVIFQLLNQPLR